MKQTTLRKQAEALNQALTELIRRYQFRNRNEICCFDVSVSQCHVLETLETRGPLSMGSLAKEMYLDISTTSRVTDQLEKKKYVRRLEHPEDRRAWLVAPTPKGVQLLKKMHDLAIQKEMEVLQQLPETSRDDAIFALRQLVEAVDSWRTSSCCVPNKLRTIKH
jgi:MarR family 2-MHQ and catechol resistance regulon transcriptional repressor